MLLAQLESLILDALASIRCNELFPGFQYGHEFEGLCWRLGAADWCAASINK